MLVGLIVIVGVCLVAAAVILFGALRWKSGTRELRDRLEAARLTIGLKAFDRRELEGLPAPVQRYFRTVLLDGQPIVAAVSVEHTGTFNISDAAEQWRPFTSTQRVITRRPGFDWDARVAMMPGVSVRVHDAYIAGKGTLHAAVFGLVSVVNLHDTPELARGELMRFLAEAAWYPTSLLPSQGVYWEAVDDHSARATLEDGDVTVTLLFRFGEDGLINTGRAEARGRMVDATAVPTPWQGRFWNYAIRDGMRVPIEGEVAWMLPEGARPYWRGQITTVTYEFSE
ncbi:MAG TPA: DUF6544 family protein [Vicinamibacterales bacterium]|jgi:hypothetical protein|nr:DUF6544 family protein [Vicinamibacterales bacterium]